MEVCTTALWIIVVLWLVSFSCLKCIGASFRVVLSLLVLCALVAPVCTQLQPPPNPRFDSNSQLVDQREALMEGSGWDDASELRLTCSISFLPQHKPYLEAPFRIEFLRQNVIRNPPIVILTVYLWAIVLGESLIKSLLIPY